MNEHIIKLMKKQTTNNSAQNAPNRHENTVRLVNSGTIEKYMNCIVLIILYRKKKESVAKFYLFNI